VTWTKLLANKEAQRHKTSKKELDNMRALIARDLADAGISRPFGRPEIRDCLQRSTPGREYGHRLRWVSDHEQGRTSPCVVRKHETCVGQPAHKYADYFETCRRKRNTIDYSFSNVATETEAKEILVQAAEFYP